MSARWLVRVIKTLSAWPANDIIPHRTGSGNGYRVSAQRFLLSATRFPPSGAKSILLPPSAAENELPIMRDEYVKAALKVIDDPNVLVNVVSLRVKQLKRGSRALVESLEKLSAEDTALREIAERKITYELATPAEIAANP